MHHESKVKKRNSQVVRKFKESQRKVQKMHATDKKASMHEIILPCMSCTHQQCCIEKVGGKIGKIYSFKEQARIRRYIIRSNLSLAGIIQCVIPETP
jgi:hypothetical protein